MLGIFKNVFSREWILTTVIVLFGSALCIRLGFWQLDRLSQRRDFNSHVQEMWAAEPILLPEDEASDLEDMEYRSICAKGGFDLDNQLIIRNQYWQDQYGYHLLTPVVFSDGIAAIVDRGWIPAEGNDQPSDWSKYDPVDDGAICGIVRLGREKPDVGGRSDPTLAPDETRLSVWNNVNLERMADQLDYDLLPVYIQLDIDPNDEQPPIPFQPEIEISEGPHIGYAGQWFMFAAILFCGYPFFIKWREKTDE